MRYYIVEKESWEVYKSTGVDTDDAGSDNYTRVFKWPRHENLVPLIDTLKETGSDIIIKFQDGCSEYHLITNI